MRTAIYEAIPPGERALAHARTALLLDRDGADGERVALHLLRSEPDGDPHVTSVLRAAATAASGRGAPGTAAGYLRRALEEPPDPAIRPAVLLELGLALASDRSPAAVEVLRQAVELAGAGDRAAAALMAARVLGIWGYHDGVIAICRDALAGRGPADELEAELFASSIISTATAGEATARAEAGSPIRAHPPRGASMTPWSRRPPPSPPATPWPAWPRYCPAACATSHLTRSPRSTPCSSSSGMTNSPPPGASATRCWPPPGRGAP